MSGRRTMVLIAVAILVLAGLVALVVYVSQDDGADRTGGSIELPPADEAGGVPTGTVDASAEPSSGVDSALTVDDPVPDAVVSELFGIVEGQGDKPVMNEQYTVQFVEDTEHVRLSGTFENGEATYEFEYDDGAWKSVSEDE